MSQTSAGEKAAKEESVKQAPVSISAPNLKIQEFDLAGAAPYVQLRFSEKAINDMMEKHAAGSQSKKGKKREPRDFDADYQRALHVSEEGWHGIPASSFRNAMISACRIAGFKMTLAKLAVFIEADGFDRVDGMPLVKIEGTPERCQHYVRNQTGVADVRIRAMWKRWSCRLRVRYDADLFSSADVMNLLNRVGVQVGIGEGRPDGKSSAGMGWGLFTANFAE